ncbi:MAG: class I SAM-dependent methyltransferase [Bacteroidota bacterium]
MTAIEVAQKAKEKYFIKRNYLAPKGFTLSYIVYRLLRPFLKINYKLFKLFHPTTPWTTQAAIDTFSRVLTKDMIGFEYGSGFSTIFFSRHLKHITSVEHNPAWHELVTKKLAESGLHNVSYHLVQPATPTANKDYRYLYEPFGLTSSDFRVRAEYDAYFSFIDQYPDEHFDFIMVDGRARVECSLLAIGKLKPGGIFVLDNSDRPRYAPVFRVLSTWKSVTSTTGLFDTTFWFKP